MVGGVTLYDGVTSEFLLNFVDTEDSNITWQARGVPTVTDNSGVFTFQYQGLFKRTKRLVTVGVSSVEYTVADDDGSNYTDQIRFEEDEFDIIIPNPLTYDYINSVLSVEYLDDNSVTQIKSTSDGSDIMFSEVETSIGRVLKITHTGMTTGGVYDWGYLEYTVPAGIPKGGTITATPVQLTTSVVDSTASPLFTTSATAAWDSTTNQLILSVTGIYQNHRVFSNLYARTLSATLETHKAIRHFGNGGFFQGEGVAPAYAADMNKLQVQPSVTLTETTRETHPYARPLNGNQGSVEIHNHINGDFLGISVNVPALTAEDVAGVTLEEMTPALDNLGRGVEDASRLKPTTIPPV